MTSTTVVVNDFTNNRRTLTLLTNIHFDFITRVWGNEDAILVDMQHNDFFTGRRRWCDLNPTHFRFMIANNLTKIASLSDLDYNDPTHPTVKSLHILLTGLVVCLQHRSECLVDLLRIARLSESEVSYDFSASLNMAIDHQRPKPSFRVIVDNG